MSTDPELRSVAFVANYVDAHRGEFTGRVEQIQQLQQLATEYRLGYSTTYPDTTVRERKRSYFEPHNGASLYETISSVVSNNDLKELRYRSADSDQAVLTFFQVGSDIFSEAYFGEIYGVLVDMGQKVASTRNIPKRRRATMKPSERSATDHAILKESAGALTEEHTAGLPRESTSNSDHSASEVAEAADNQVSPGRMGRPEEAQHQGETSFEHDVSANDDQGRQPSADHNSRSKVGREHDDDETNHEDLLNIDIGDILRAIHSSIRIAVTELLAKAADDQAAYFNLKPTKDLETLYKTAFGKAWQTDMTLMVTRSQLTVADSVRSLIWAFIVGEYFGGGNTLPDTLQSLCERDGTVRRWITPLLAERGLDFNELCGRAMINQFQDPDFTKSIIQPAIYQLAIQVCMILNGHIGLLHESFVHNHWRAKFMPSLRNILEWVLKLQVKMYADPRKHSFAMYNYGKPFLSDWMTAESGWEGDIVGITTMPGICRQGIDAKEVVAKAEVRLMTASLEEDDRD